jgi:hypothetical protein
LSLVKTKGKLFEKIINIEDVITAQIPLKKQNKRFLFILKNIPTILLFNLSIKTVYKFFLIPAATYVTFMEFKASSNLLAPKNFPILIFAAKPIPKEN